MEFSKSEQRCLNRLQGKRRISWWQSIGLGILSCVLIQLALNVIPRVLLLYVLVIMFALGTCRIMWERFLLSGIIMKLQERIMELELTSHQRRAN